MSVPNLTSSYPANNDVGIPVGEQLVLTFDSDIDVTTLKNFVVLYGNDFDKTSGAESQLWVNPATTDNPYFLRSPGFKGLVDLKFRATYFDVSSNEDTLSLPVSPADTTGLGMRVYVTPSTGQLAPDTEYTLQVLGDPAQLNGVSSRTVYEVSADAGNAGATGAVIVTGGYTGTTQDVLNVQITSSGDIGQAKYKYWLTSAGIGEAVSDKLTNRRFRAIGNGLQIRFSGIDFQAGDLYTVDLESKQVMPATVKIVFTTNDGTYSEAPDSPSTPAVSEPPAESVPPFPGASTAEKYLQIEEMNPPDGAYNVSTKNRRVQILFSDVLDATTVNNETVHMYRYPALGYWQGQEEPIELKCKITTSGQLVTLEF